MYSRSSGYQRVSENIGSPRDNEVMAFRLAIHHLVEAKTRSARAAALNINYRLWQFIFQDLHNENNILPEILKQDLLNLAAWSMEYSTRAVLLQISLKPLINVNLNVLHGLEANTKKQTSSATTQREWKNSTV